MAKVKKREYRPQVQKHFIYQEKWKSVLAQPTLQELPKEAQQAIDSIARIGYEHAISKRDYQDDLLDYMTKWAVYTLPNSTDFTSAFVYDSDIGTIDFISWDDADVKLFIQDAALSRKAVPLIAPPNKTAETSEREYMKRLIPLSYALMGLLFLSLSLLFGFTFYLGQHGGAFIIGPWANLMLLVAALGLMVTVVAASIEWRKLQGGKEENEKNG